MATRHFQYDFINGPINGPIKNFTYNKDNVYFVQFGQNDGHKINWTEIKRSDDSSINNFLNNSSWNENTETFISHTNNLFHMRLFRRCKTSPHDYDICTTRLRKKHLPLKVQIQKVDFYSDGFNWSPELEAIFIWNETENCISILHPDEKTEIATLSGGWNSTYKLYLGPDKTYGVRINSILLNTENTQKILLKNKINMDLSDLLDSFHITEDDIVSQLE